MTLLLFSALCAGQAAGTQTQPNLAELFRSQPSVVDRTKVLLDWGYQHGGEGVEELISDFDVGVVSRGTLSNVIVTFVGDLKKRAAELVKLGLFEKLTKKDTVSLSSFNDVKRIAEAPGYDRWVKQYVSDFDSAIFVNYVKMAEDKRPQRVVAVTFGLEDPKVTIRLYFFYRLTKEDWAIDGFFPQIEVSSP